MKHAPNPAEAASPADIRVGPTDALAGFHPAIRRWFEDRFEAPTPAQEEGWPAIRRGRHTLISAPTGSGKTLAAFLHALDALLREGLAAAEARGQRLAAEDNRAAAAGGAGTSATPAADDGGTAAIAVAEDGAPLLPDEVRVVYVSPLKALSADIHRNLIAPRKEIRRVVREMGLPEARISAAVRSGDTPRSAREAMVRRPPHILVTTPESLYLLLTARRSREILRSVHTVIVDEIHAVLESRRGSHLALSLERLEHVTGRPLQRIGLSATQKPIEEVARFLVGGANTDDRGVPDCRIIDRGHMRELDLGLEVPGSPLEAVMSHEVWDEVYDRIAELVGSHRTTLVFVNTRRVCERVTRHLAERLGEEAVASHHGSLSMEMRLDAERRLKAGSLRALVATASLELGIDIGHVDLVCQLGSPNRIAAFLQRVGRSGHTVRGTPKGRLFPLSRDDLLECAALLAAARRGELDRAILIENPLDVLAQQVVAEVAAEEWEEDALYTRFRRAWPYRDLSREEFGEVVEMLSRGFVTGRGRRGARLHRDAVNGRLRGRKGARLAALTSGGAIPDAGDFRVLMEPTGMYVGTINEDFAIESIRGDIFQLGNASWEILKVETGVVRVADAHGKPPTIPFWLGEAPARSTELSHAVSELRREVGERLGVLPGTPGGPSRGGDGGDGRKRSGGDGLDRSSAADWLAESYGIPGAAAFQIVHQLAESKRLLGALPTCDTLILERFFDEAGGMQLVVHSPLGSRINRAWGLALRKRFCRKFNFELQAAATENGILLSLGPQHSFPLEEVFRYLNPATVRDVLIQAMLDAPVFQTRWRWNATLALAVLRWRGGKKTPPQLQRMQSEDLLAACFPDAAACLEHVAGNREIPDHPLVRQTIEDCLTDAMDLPGLVRLLEGMGAGELELLARDVPEPSTLAHELLTARPYAFLDDAPAEERRALAVQSRRALDPSAARELGALDPEAIERVRDEAWPDPETADELHDALLVGGFLTEEEGERGRGDPSGGGGKRNGEGLSWRPLFEALREAGRAVRVLLPERRALWMATERLPELRAARAEARWELGSAAVSKAHRESGPAAVPGAFAGVADDREGAIRELLRGRIEMLGPVTAASLGAALGVDDRESRAALLALEGEGSVLRGAFTPAGEGAEERGAEEVEEWCERRLLARIHRYTLQRLRAEIAPVTTSDFMRFLFEWQRVTPGHRVAGADGLAAVLEQLDGYELAAAAWEPDVLSARVEDYEPALLDSLCLTGRARWGRLAPPAGARNGSETGNGSRARNGSSGSGPMCSSPVSLFLRESASHWLALAGKPGTDDLSSYARTVLRALDARGACFFDDLTRETGLLHTQVERALGELAALGLVTSDGFAGLRALLTPSDRRPPIGNGKHRRRGRVAPYGVESAGRWSQLRPGAMDGLTPENGRPPPGSARGTSLRPGRADREEVSAFARTLLRRYGVVFRKLLEREANTPPWRELLMVYRQMEARGDVRGGRFVAGFSGEQFALPGAVGKLRAARKAEPTGCLISLSAADPLNLAGIITPGERIPAVATNRLVFRDGVPVAARVAGEIRSLLHHVEGKAAPDRREVEKALVRKIPPKLRWYVGRAG